MKRLGLGLAALAAIGTLSPACAASLEEAIKGVETSGFVRFKYGVKDRDDDQRTIETHRYSAQLNLTAPIEDDFYASASLSADKDEKPALAASEPAGGYDAASNKGLYNDRLYFMYKTDDLNVKLGKFEPTTPWTETGFNASRGNGLVAQYTGVEDWKFVGNAFVQTNGFDDTNVLGTGVGAANGQGGSGHNFYALGVVGSFGEKIGLDAQVWAGKYENIIDSMVFANLRYKIDSFYVRAQAAATTLDESFQNLAGFADDTGLYYGGEIGFRNDDFFVRANYVQTDKDQPFYALDGDNDGFIKHGSDLYYLTTNVADTSTIFVSAGFWIDKLGFRVGYGLADSGSKGYDAKISELYATGTYKVTPKLNAQLTFATYDGDDKYTVWPGNSSTKDYNSISAEIYYGF
ncbi:hypothetical protein AGMMS50229_04260 [Campylobacterota bacterium]|nr:hypothetical protein AGMMS50229_04260 [Campylobacterota bacterium]